MDLTTLAIIAVVGYFLLKSPAQQEYIPLPGEFYFPGYGWRSWSNRPKGVYPTHVCMSNSEIKKVKITKKQAAPVKIIMPEFQRQAQGLPSITMQRIIK